MQHSNWQPSASIQNLKKRAEVVRLIRKFFNDKGFLEVETPALANAPVTDPHLVNFKTEFLQAGACTGQPLYLQTSPEYAMKRLLCEGSGNIFQIAKAFRNEEAGSHHNPEFTMLEWYHIDYDHFQLMEEVEQLVRLVLNAPEALRFTYQEAFIQYLEIDPLEASTEELRDKSSELGHGDIAQKEQHRDTLLQLMFSMNIETRFPKDKPVFVYNFPKSQAALAKLSEQDSRVAERFELYFAGIELANGFHELQDPKEQALRFEQDNKTRKELGLPEAPIDHHFLTALQHGLPNCSGVALGIDRFVMLACKSKNIQEVISFDTFRA